MNQSQGSSTKELTKILQAINIYLL